MDLSNLSRTLPSGPSVSSGPGDSTGSTTSGTSDPGKLSTHFKSTATAVTSLYNAPSAAAFSDAAKQVAAFYRAASLDSRESHAQGYLRCIDDLLGAITRGHDIENWALTRRAELLKSSLADPRPSSDEEEVFQIPQDYEFSLASDLRTSHRFPALMPPLSVHGPTSKPKRSKTKRDLRKDPILSDSDREEARVLKIKSLEPEHKKKRKH